MALQTEAEQKAEEFISKVESLVRSEDGLIYQIESSVGKPNAISPTSVGKRDAWVEVTLYNVSDPDDALSAYKWVRLGEMGADVDLHSGSYRNGYNASIEIHKRIS